MAKHAHHHGADNGLDQWARRHLEVGDLREPELVKATTALLEAARVARGHRVLDVACGAGYTTAAATAAGAEATGLDSSADMIRIAKERFPGTDYLEGDMLAPPEGPWDAVVCRMGAHHADPSWLKAAFAVLKPGGRLALAERDAVDAEDRAKGMKTLVEWVRLMEEAGLEQVDVTATGADLDGRIHVVAGRKPIRRRSS